jgi:hypothetical protein
MGRSHGAEFFAVFIGEIGTTAAGNQHCFYIVPPLPPGTPRQLSPPSCVVNCLPSLAKTVAESSSLAATLTKSASVGGVIAWNCSPSVVRKTVPPRPTTQQISAEGAAPANRSFVVPLLTGRQ